MGMEEVASQINGAYADEIMAAEAHIRTARSLMEAATAHVGAAIAGSEQEHAQNFLELLAKITEDIGNVAVGMSQAGEAKDRLFKTWGVSLSPPQPEATASVRSGLQDTVKPLEAAVARKAPPEVPELLQDVKVLAERTPANENYTSTRIQTVFDRTGLTTIRDIVLMGTDVLAEIRTMSPARAEWVKNAVQASFPGVTVPKKTSAALAARICNSIDEVPLAVLDPGAEVLTGRKHLKVSDIVYKPLAEIIDDISLGYHAQDPESEGYKNARLAYDRLLARAQDYTAKFNAAKEHAATE